MKNHIKISRIQELHQLWMAFDANASIWIESMGKVVAARFIRSWSAKKLQDRLKHDEIYLVRKKLLSERMGLTLEEAVAASGVIGKLMRGV